MRRWLRALLFLGLLLLLTTVCFAAEQPAPGGSFPCHFERNEKSVLACGRSTDFSVAGSLEMTDNWLEQLWENRVIEEASAFSFTLTDCGETVIEQTAQGALDVSFAFEHTDWSHFSVRYDEEGQTGGTAYGFDPFGDNAVLRARCFLYRENGDLFVCQCCEIITQDDVMMNRSINTQEVQPDQNAFCLRFESYPLETSPAEAFSQSADDERNPAAPVTATRCWTYCSSDDRPLWTVDLTGVYASAVCLQANGTVTILDPTWILIEASFYPDRECAVCLLTLRHTTLGIPTATRTYEFRLPPP